jgi:maltose alpha-D-glucosyltransferase / alpha-amylase
LVTLVEELLSARWFGGKSRGPRAARIIDRGYWADGASLCLAEVEYEHGPPDVYALAERFEEPGVARALLEHFDGAVLPTEADGQLVFESTHVLRTVKRERTEPIVPLRGEQSNSSLRFGDSLILKLFRRVQFGPQPEVEIGRFLTEHTQFHGTPAVAGSASYTAPDGKIAALALLQCFEPNRGDAWRTTLARLEKVLGGASLDDSIRAVTRLAHTTADLHIALASRRDVADFAPEPIGSSDISAWRAAIQEEVLHASEALRRHLIQVEVESMLERANGVAALFGSEKIRHHGDYHLGQVLEREDGEFAIIDFEGEPSKPLAVRRQKRSALRDVAGMLRSFDYARNAALRAGNLADPRCVDRASEWYALMRRAFLDAYVSSVRAAAPALLPPDVDAPLAALELEKAAYEALYELNNRPDWLPIPLAALTSRPH